MIDTEEMPDTNERNRREVLAKIRKMGADIQDNIQLAHERSLFTLRQTAGLGPSKRASFVGLPMIAIGVLGSLADLLLPRVDYSSAVAASLIVGGSALMIAGLTVETVLRIKYISIRDEIKEITTAALRDLERLHDLG